MRPQPRFQPSLTMAAPLSRFACGHLLAPRYFGWGAFFGVTVDGTGEFTATMRSGLAALTAETVNGAIRRHLSGENIFPAEIENVLVTHPGVAEVAVVGVPDPHWGEIVICFLRARAGAKLTVADLVRHVRRDLAAPKTPARWIELDVFPLTGSGKIQKFVLRDRYLQGEYAGFSLHGTA